MKMQVYFHTEDQAEDAASSIRKYGVNDVLVDRIPEAAGRDMVLIPASGIGSAGTGYPGQPGAFASAKEIKDSFTGGNYPEYVLEFEADPEYKENILSEIKKTDGYIDEKYREQ